MSGIAPILLRSQQAQSATVLFLHGLGDTGYGWESTMRMVQRKMPHIKFILPTAPTRPITLNFGAKMPGWYDIQSLTDRDTEDEVGIRETTAFVHKMIQDEISSGTPSERIVVGGFSQGGAISLLSGITCPARLGGIMALSTYLPLRKSVPQNATPENLNTPVLMCHGTDDMVVHYKWGKLSEEFLTHFRKTQQSQQQQQQQQSPPMEVPDFSRMSTKDLKDLLLKHHIDISSCIEKTDLLEKAKVQLPQLLAAPSDTNVNIEFKSYSGMQHEACEEEILDIINWLKKTLPPQ